AHSAQARAYRAARNVSDEGTAIAVLVQRMVAAVRSGGAFTVNPVTGADELVVNSVAGLGGARVSGLVERAEGSLPKSHQSELARLLVRIEDLYGAPQDIEWCHDGLRYWIVQSRPVTTRFAPNGAAAPNVDAGSAAPQPAGAARIEWTRANL